MKKITLALAMMFALLAALVGPANAQDGARIHLLHGIPDVDVDVEAGGANVIEGFSFGDTQDLSSLAGSTLEGLKVKAAGTDTVAIDAGDVALPAAGNFTAVAHLDADGVPALTVFENDTSTIAAGEGRLVVRHAAAAPEVDILADGAVAFAAVPNGAEGSIDLPAGTISASVVPAGATEPVVIGPADLPITEGSSLTVYAVGSLDGETLTVLTESIDGLGSAPAAVNTGNSPIESSSGANTLLLLGLALALAAAGSTVLVAARR
ncbi:MAG: DUF4397 domain-containing protein [Acidimicrobiales bacterium]|nr:DUF4397 domain-containing protein [Acidimicrobiales bacterium]